MAMSKDLKVLAVTGTGTTQAAGALLNGDINICTATGTEAFTIPANLPTGTVFFAVGGAGAGVVFPPLGGAINGGTANASKPLDASVVHMYIVTASGTSSTYRCNKLAALSA